MIITFVTDVGNRSLEICGESSDVTPGVNTSYWPELLASQLKFAIVEPSQRVWPICTFTTVHVETAVTCEYGRCTPSRIRSSQRSSPPPNWTVFDTAPHDGLEQNTIGRFFGNLANNGIGTVHDSAEPNTLAGYIADPRDRFRTLETWLDLSQRFPWTSSRTDWHKSSILTGLQMSDRD